MVKGRKVINTGGSAGVTGRRGKLEAVREAERRESWERDRWKNKKRLERGSSVSCLRVKECCTRVYPSGEDKGLGEQEGKGRPWGVTTGRV